MALISLQNGTKSYRVGGQTINVLKDISLTLDHGDFSVIMGPSGSGKSTLLQILGCLDRLTTGDYVFDGQNVNKKLDHELSTLRSQKIGFIFQQFNLIRQYNVLENVSMPFLYSPNSLSAAREASLNAIEKVGLSHRLRHKTNELSGGEMQRVAIARAMVLSPKLILADEPTGNLDSRTGGKIMDIIMELNDGGTSIVMVTHDRNIAMSAKTLLTIQDGRFV